MTRRSDPIVLGLSRQVGICLCLRAIGMYYS